MNKSMLLKVDENSTSMLPNGDLTNVDLMRMIVALTALLADICDEDINETTAKIAAFIADTDDGDCHLEHEHSAQEIH